MTINHTDYILFGIAKLNKYKQNQKKRSSYLYSKSFSRKYTGTAFLSSDLFS